MQGQIEESAYREAVRQSSGASIVVGVNRFGSAEEQPVPVLEVDPALEKTQQAEVAARRSARDSAAVERSLQIVTEIAAGDQNLMPPMRDALAAGATIGEVSDALRAVFGVHRPTG
jgi:methylmalonyl-CoA mutase N-terminal domain/subunit